MSKRRVCRTPGFTLVELLVVMVVIAMMLALLVPAIMGSVRKANNARTTMEINGMAQALQNFRSLYGSYPPSQIALVEDGNYSLSNLGAFGPLQARSVSALRQFWPRLPISTSGPAVSKTSNVPGSFLDFDGDRNNSGDQVFVLSGHQCLVFFLGGLSQKTANGGLVVTGFARNPANPFIAAADAANRQEPFYDFNNSRIQPDPKALAPQFPAFLDPLGGGFDPNLPGFYVYFSAYGGAGYDPDDVNFSGGEVDASNNPILGAFMTPNDVLGVRPVTARPDWVSSPYPNPYLNDLPIPVSGNKPNPADTRMRAYQNGQTFQIISPGYDRQYGIGGEYNPSRNATMFLPFTSAYQQANAAVTGQSLELNVRQAEADNLTNFATGPIGP